MFLVMVGSFDAIVGLVVIAVIILFAVGAVSFVGYEASDSNKSSLGIAPSAAQSEAIKENE